MNTKSEVDQEVAAMKKAEEEWKAGVGKAAAAHLEASLHIKASVHQKADQIWN